MHTQAVIALQSGGHQAPGNIGVPQYHRLQGTELVVGTHLIDHAGAMQEGAPQGAAGHYKTMQPIILCCDQLGF